MDLGDLNSICENFDYQLPKDITLKLKKTLCKHFYKLFVGEVNTETTAIKSWRKLCPEDADTRPFYSCLLGDLAFVWQ